MATLKGQNFRILTENDGDWSVIGMATNCVVTLTGNSEEAATKDDAGLAAKPTITSKGWQVQVEALKVTDVGVFLTAVKNMTPFTLLWDKTEGTNNNETTGASYSRTGQAYLSDFTATWNDRENSVKNLTFSGTGALEEGTGPETQSPGAGAYTKGQYVRLFLSGDNTTTPLTVIGAARQLSLHVSLTLENSTTKDTTGDWVVQEPTALSYDITSGALVESGEDITSSVSGTYLEDLVYMYENATPCRWQIANVSGANNRTKGAIICSGSVILTQLQINAAVKTPANYTATMQGYGPYTVGA